MDNKAKKISVLAPAKINLYLGVASKREDGYHDIMSVMQTVGLCDKVTVTSRGGSGQNIYAVCRGIPDISNEKNIAYRAAKEFFSYTKNEKYDLSIEIEKRIPMQAGLGGGSSDAAATLHALDTLFGTRLSEKELIEIGARVGADVPFLIRRGTAIVTGIGEKLSDCAPAPSATVLIAFPKRERISTKEAYAKIDEYGLFSSEEDFEKMKSAMRSCELGSIAAASHNIFEKVIDPASAVFDIKKKMNENGAAMSMMSGSGSAVFGIFADTASAKNTVCSLSGIAETFVCGMFTKDMPYIEN